MDYLDEIAREQRNQIEAVEKGFDPFYISPEDIEKGRKAQLGEIRHWKDGDYKMTVNGWEYVKGSDPNIKSKKKSEGTPSAKEVAAAARDRRLGAEYAKNPKRVEEPKTPAFKVGDTVQITDETLGPASLMHLKGKDLKVLGTEKGTLSQPVFFRVGDGEEGGKWDVVIPPTYLKAGTISDSKDVVELSSAIEGLKSELKSSKQTAIIAATDSYRHSQETLDQIQDKISILHNIKDKLTEKEKSFDIKLSESSYEGWSSTLKEKNRVMSAIIAYEIAQDSSRTLQKYGVTKSANDGMYLMADARSLIHRAQYFEKEIFTSGEA